MTQAKTRGIGRKWIILFLSLTALLAVLLYFFWKSDPVPISERGFVQRLSETSKSFTDSIDGQHVPSINSENFSDLVFYESTPDFERISKVFDKRYSMYHGVVGITAQVDFKNNNMSDASLKKYYLQIEDYLLKEREKSGFTDCLREMQGKEDYKTGDDNPLESMSYGSSLRFKEYTIGFNGYLEVKYTAPNGKYCTYRNGKPHTYHSNWSKPKATPTPAPAKKPHKHLTHHDSDLYDADDYDNGDDFADDWAEEFGDGDEDDGYDDAYDYWEEWNDNRKE